MSHRAILTASEASIGRNQFKHISQVLIINMNSVNDYRPNMHENIENLTALDREPPQTRTIADIQIEYSHAASQLGDYTCRIALLQSDIDTLHDRAQVFKAAMLKLHGEARKLSQPEAPHVQ